MSTDLPPDFQDAEDPPPHPPEMGHSGADWGNYQTNDLDDLQFRAINLTIQGLGDVQVAKMLSIDRKTLWRWKTYDEDYRLALAEARSQIHAAVADRYRTLLMRATGVMAKFLDDTAENNRFRASYALLMMVGSFKPLPSPAPLPNQDYFPMPIPELPPSGMNSSQPRDLDPR